MLFKKWYPLLFAVGSLLILGATTAYWALLSARVNSNNADQSIDVFLFEHKDTLHQAILPSAHTFLLKWPLFALIKIIGISEMTVTYATVILVLITVGCFAYILFRIAQRRLIIFGGLCLALSSVLLMIPVEPYPGALLPSNMAMLTTRNIEYIIYILGLILVIRSPSIKHYMTGLAVGLFTLLAMSDKLFIPFILGGAVGMLLMGYIRRQEQERTIALRWLSVGILSVVLSVVGLWALTNSHIAALSHANQAEPYALVSSTKQFIIGCTYAAMGIATNLGANPAFATRIVKDIPAAIIQGLTSPNGIPYAINSSILFFCGVSIWYSLRLRKSKKRSTVTSDPAKLLTLAMIWTTCVALGSFILTNHYYPVDERYLTISLFTCFIALACWLRNAPSLPPLSWRLVIGALLVISIVVGIFATQQTTSQSTQQYSEVAKDTDFVNAILKQHSVDVLLGDYWHVIPIKLDSPKQVVYPLSDCTVGRDTLTSGAWNRDLHSTRFAYLLTLKSSVTGFPRCSIDQIVTKYGRPNSSQVIKGSASNPDEVVLFYDHGISQLHTPNTKLSQPIYSIIPRNLDDLKQQECPNDGKVFMNIVAHQDDDLLFINPDTYHALHGGSCVHSVYITSGDAGQQKFYWLGREEGSKAAYATMLGDSNPIWFTRTVTLPTGGNISLARIKGDYRVSLIFMHLPDGNLKGQGFAATNYESLLKLRNGTIPSIHAVDGQSVYTSKSLISGLVSIMQLYQPNEIRTQAKVNHSQRYPDHSDHLQVGWYADQAFNIYQQDNSATQISHYIGYPEHEYPINVSGDDLKAVEAAFFAYAAHDKSVCVSTSTCEKTAYASYLNRQYQGE